MQDASNGTYYRVSYRTQYGISYRHTCKTEREALDTESRLVHDTYITRVSVAICDRDEDGRERCDVFSTSTREE